MMEIFYLEKGIKKAASIQKISGKNVWIDCTDITKEEANLLGNTFKLHPLSTEDLYNHRIRVKVEEFPEYLFCVFYGISTGKKTELVEFDFVIGNNFIITNHKKDLASSTSLKNNAEKLESLFTKGNDFILHRLLDNEVDNFFPVLEKLDDQIESLEEEITRNPHSALLTKILKLKRHITQIKKTVLPQREKISFLAKNDYRWISKKAIPYFRDIYDHAIRVSDIIDNYREAVGNTFDAYMSAISNRMNEVMKVLSIIATIALPLSVISGIYGTNFAVLPGAAFPNGFWIMIAVMVLMGVGMLHFFRKRGWF